MKNKLKFLPFLFLGLSIVLNSCSSENLDKQEYNNEITLKSNNLDNELLADPVFTSLIEKNDFLSKQNFNLDLLKTLVNAESDDLGLYAEALGFDNQSDLITFQEAWIDDLHYLDQNYNLSEKNPSQLSILINESEYYQTESDDCDRERRNCVVSASSVYVLEALGCSALNLTLFGGVICYGVITAQYLAATDTCTIQWNRCNDA